MALFAGVARLLLEADDRSPGSVIDRDFIDTYCAGFAEYEAQARAVDLDTVLEATGISANPTGTGGHHGRRIGAHGGVLGDGPHPAPARGGDDLGDQPTCC